MIIKKCNMCGKEFDREDNCEDFSISERCGYGSKYDGSNVEINLCCSCFDKLIDVMIEKCVYSPIERNL